MNPGEIILGGSMLLALPLALLAGILSFVSPCVLPLVPGYLGLLSGAVGEDAPARVAMRRALQSTALFVLGFSLVFVSFGALFGGLGAIVYANGLSWVQRVLGVLVIALGLVFIGQFSWLQRSFRLLSPGRVGPLAAPLLGIAFGLGWTPCIGPTLAAVLTLASDSANPWRGAVLALAYSLGIGIPFLLLAAGYGRAVAAVGFVRRNIRVINLIGGVLLVALGVLLVTGWWNLLAAWLQNELFGGFTLWL